jgi:hypothetical protein
MTDRSPLHYPRFFRCFAKKLERCSAASDHIENKYCQGQHEQEMNKAAADMGD